jgi:hypothetical protein
VQNLAALEITGPPGGQMQKFFTRCYDDSQVYTVEVEKETASSVWIKGHRNAKVSEYSQYFDTELLAWQSLIDRFTGKHDRNKKQAAQYWQRKCECESAAKKVESGQTVAQQPKY